MGRRGGRGSDAEQTAAKLAVSVHELAERVRLDAAALAELATTEAPLDGFVLCRMRDHAVICRHNAGLLVAELAKSKTERHP